MKTIKGLDDGLKSKKRKAREEAELLSKLKEETDFEKGDYPALIVAALVTLVPIVLLMLFLYFQVSKIFFG